MNTLSKADLLKANAAIHAIAKKNSITENEVRAEMTLAIESGYNNPDPTVQAYWRSTPFSGRKPSPEEFLLWCANQL